MSTNKRGWIFCTTLPSTSRPPSARRKSRRWNRRPRARLNRDRRRPIEPGADAARHKSTDLDRYIYLVNLLDHDDVLFYRAVMSDPARFLPIVYDPNDRRSMSEGSATSIARRAACISR